MQTHISPASSESTSSSLGVSANSGHYVAHAMREDRDGVATIHRLNDGTVTSATMHDLCDSSSYVLLLRRRRPAVIETALDPALYPIRPDTTVFRVPRRDAGDNLKFLRNGAADPRLMDEVMNMHVKCLRVAAHRLGRAVCIYSSFTYVCINTADRAIDRLLEYPATHGRRERVHAVNPAAPAVSTVDLLSRPAYGCLPPGCHSIFETDCVMLPVNVDPLGAVRHHPCCRACHCLQRRVTCMLRCCAAAGTLGTRVHLDDLLLHRGAGLDALSSPSGDVAKPTAGVHALGVDASLPRRRRRAVPRRVATQRRT